MFFNEDYFKLFVIEAMRNGMDDKAVIAELVRQFGYAQHVARRLFIACVLQDGNGGRLDSQLPWRKIRCPYPIRTHIGNFVFEEREMRVAFAHLYPSIYLIENVVSAEECEELIALARDSSRPAQLVLPSGGEAIQGAYGRDNSTTPLVEAEGTIGVRLLRRFSALVNWPANWCEVLEVQHYREGQAFDLHVDYLDPHTMQTNSRAAQSGNCMGNLIVYLNEPPDGGSTYFANLGLEIAPRARAALFFNYPTMAVDSMTLHAGSRVMKGEKFIATTVFRQRNWARNFDYRDSSDAASEFLYHK